MKEKLYFNFLCCHTVRKQSLQSEAKIGFRKLIGHSKTPIYLMNWCKCIENLNHELTSQTSLRYKVFCISNRSTHCATVGKLSLL